MTDYELRKHLTQLLEGGEAHIKFENVVKDFPLDKAGVRPAGSPHSAWELLEHIRIAQHDIVAFSDAGKNSSGYKPMKWPDEYWPKSAAPKDSNEWANSVTAIQQDLAAFLQLMTDPKRDLFEPFAWGDGQTLLREAMLIADHNSYHLGQLMLVRRMIE